MQPEQPQRSKKRLGEPSQPRGALVPTSGPFQRNNRQAQRRGAPWPRGHKRDPHGNEVVLLGLLPVLRCPIAQLASQVLEDLDLLLEVLLYFRRFPWHRCSSSPRVPPAASSSGGRNDVEVEGLAECGNRNRWASNGEGRRSRRRVIGLGKEATSSSPIDPFRWLVKEVVVKE